MALLAQTIAIAGSAATSGNTKALDKWVETLVGRKMGKTAPAELSEFIRTLEQSGMVKVHGSNRR